MEKNLGQLFVLAKLSGSGREESETFLRLMQSIPCGIKANMGDIISATNTLWPHCRKPSVSKFQETELGINNASDCQKTVIRVM
jgi:hypothetical protein